MFVINARQLEGGERGWDLKPIYCVPNVHIYSDLSSFFPVCYERHYLGPVLAPLCRLHMSPCFENQVTFLNMKLHIDIFLEAKMTST